MTGITEEEEVVTDPTVVSSSETSINLNSEDGDDELPLPPPRQTDSDAYDTDLECEVDQLKTYKSMTGKDIYIRSCEQCNVVPASYFIKNMTNDTMNMAHHGLGPQGAKALAAPLVVNTSVINLNLEDNWLTAEGAKDIAEMLLENCYITDLNLAMNKLGTKGARCICEMLTDNANLRKVNVARNDFKDKDAEYFAEAFRTNFRLKEFDLSGNEFCEIGGDYLGQAIAANESIEKLNLSWNHLRLKGALAVCAGMKINITIRSLDLSWNGFADEGAAAMGEALKTNNTLTTLDLSHNRISGEGARLLAKGLAVNDTLKILRLGGNPINSESALALLQAIASNNKSAIEVLDLQGVSVSKAFTDLVEELSKKVRANGSKTNLNVSVRKHDSMPKVSLKKMEEGDGVLMIQEFLEKKRLRLLDLFRAFDKECTWRITEENFKKAIKDSGVIISNFQINALMRNLGRDEEGLIDYSEMGIGRKEALQRRRQSRRRSTIMISLKQAQQKLLQDKFEAALNRVTVKNSPTNSLSGSRHSSPQITPTSSQIIHSNSWLGQNALAPNNFTQEDPQPRQPDLSDDETEDIILPIPRLYRRR